MPNDNSNKVNDLIGKYGLVILFFGLFLGVLSIFISSSQFNFSNTKAGSLTCVSCLSLVLTFIGAYGTIIKLFNKNDLLNEQVQHLIDKTHIYHANANDAVQDHTGIEIADEFSKAKKIKAINTLSVDNFLKTVNVENIIKNCENYFNKQIDVDAERVFVFDIDENDKATKDSKIKFKNFLKWHLEKLPQTSLKFNNKNTSNNSPAIDLILIENKDYKKIVAITKPLSSTDLASGPYKIADTTSPVTFFTIKDTFAYIGLEIVFSSLWDKSETITSANLDKMLDEYKLKP